MATMATTDRMKEFVRRMSDTSRLVPASLVGLRWATVEASRLVGRKWWGAGSGLEPELRSFSRALKTSSRVLSPRRALAQCEPYFCDVLKVFKNIKENDSTGWASGKIAEMQRILDRIISAANRGDVRSVIAAADEAADLAELVASVLHADVNRIDWDLDAPEVNACMRQPGVSVWNGEFQATVYDAAGVRRHVRAPSLTAINEAIAHLGLVVRLQGYGYCVEPIRAAEASA